ncbi:MAG: ATP-binding protein [Gillisia sp.]
MKKLFYTVLILFLPFYATSQSQHRTLDSLHQELKNSNDTVKMKTLNYLANLYTESNRDSALYFNEKHLDLTKKLKQPLFTSDAILHKAYLVQQEGNFPLAFKLNNASMAISKDIKQEENPHINYDLWQEKDPRKIRLRILASGYHSLGVIYGNVGNIDKSIENFKEAIRIGEKINDINVISNSDIGQSYLSQNNLDSAWHYTTKAIKNSNISGYKIYQGAMLNNLGTIFFKLKQLDSANHYYRKALIVSDEQNFVSGKILANLSLAEYYESKSNVDSMYYHATKAYTISRDLKESRGVAYSSELISKIHKSLGNTDSAFTYLAMSKRIGDSLRTARETNLTEFLNMGFEEQMLREKAVQENIAFKNKIRTIGLFAGLGLLALLAFIFFRNNRQKQKKNAVLENTLKDLKSTQTQLIQSEKMASLGELTAGIAHEIQNPLNFVNNFADVSDEMLDELKEELAKGDISEAIILANDVKSNLQKITHHGKRADAIVKGMLAHSRAGSSERQPTDINALADEYLRLSYHGIRAKNKNFNSDFKTDFAGNLPRLNVAAQDIGRVLLNLFNNAFYAVQEKAEKEALLAVAQSENGAQQISHNIIATAPYAPMVKVKTQLKEGKVIITVTDNANGIPQAIKEKIFQPFFTTKPTGEGTGLGLSLSYDIVKAHGGEITVDSKEGEGTMFTIQLPRTNGIL